MILPSGDVYSFIALIFQTWKFENIDSVEVIGCRAFYGKDEQDLMPSQKDCTTCITRNVGLVCGQYVSSLKKLTDIDNNNQCEDKKWRVNPRNVNRRNGLILEEGECDKYHHFLKQIIITLKSKSRMKTKFILMLVVMLMVAKSTLILLIIMLMEYMI